MLAVADERRTTVLFDARAPAIDLDLFGRIARDFPPQIGILVRGGGDDARAQLYGCGVYRARVYVPSPTASCDQSEGTVTLAASDVLDRVRARLEVPATIPASELRHRS